MHRYLAYGLAIDSAMPLPELIPLDSGVPPDVVIRYGDLPLPARHAFETFYLARTDGNTASYYLRDIGGVQVRGGREVIVHPLPGVEAQGFRFLVSGIALGLVLHQRGIMTLHGSAVAIGGAAVAFVGWKGMGKSTLAAALHGHGHAVLTDDLITLEMGDEAGTVNLVPGFPHLKLDPEAVRETLDGRPQDLPLIHPKGTKRAAPVMSGFRADGVPLRRIFVLDWAEPEEAAAWVPLEPRAAYVELVRHSFALRILEEKAVTHRHMQQCAQLVGQVPVVQLRRHRSFEALETLVHQIVREVAPVPHEATSGGDGEASGPREHGALDALPQWKPIGSDAVTVASTISPVR